MKNAGITTLGAGAVAFVLLVIALPAYGGTFQLYMFHDFVESLIERGIVPEHMAPKAREIAATISIVKDFETNTVPYREHVAVSASQLIQHSHRTYKAGSDVEGLILLATNTHTEDIYPSAKRQCQVTYRIYQGDELAYDRSTEKSCATDEQVTYRLAPGQSRMFELTHTALSHPLSPGRYTFVLEYPGYGSGTREVTIE